MLNRDNAAVEKIRAWLATRESERVAWKKVSSLAQTFGLERLTTKRKQRISLAMAEAGIELEPALQELGPEDTVSFRLAERAEARLSPVAEGGTHTARLPNQIITWDPANIGEDDGTEQWLYCLKATGRGDRQLVWEGGSKRGIVGMVTFSGQIRNKGVIEGWGRHESFQTPITREQLLTHPATSSRFDARGIKALQGSAIRLTEAEAAGILALMGGLPPTEIPWSEPDDAEPVPWVARKGLPAEKFTENAILQSRALWRKMGLAEPPKQQVTWSTVGRLDLLSGNTVIEVKKSVTADNGPAQIQRYLAHLAKELRVGPREVRGLLVQKNTWAAPNVLAELAKSPYPIELWSVDKDEQQRWRALRIKA